MTLLYYDINHNNTKLFFAIDCLIGSDILGIKNDLEMLERMIVLVLKGHQYNTRMATSEAEDLVRKVESSSLKEPFLLNLVISFEHGGGGTEIQHLKASIPEFKAAS